MIRYQAVFESCEPEDRGFCVTFPDLPGCITEGDSVEEAKERAKAVLSGHLKLYVKNHEEIPEPTQQVLQEEGKEYHWIEVSSEVEEQMKALKVEA